MGDINNIKDKCGVFALYDNKNIYKNLINGLSLLQHRGQESAGISYIENREFKTYKKNGLVKDIFYDIDKKIDIKCCIGHVRYSTQKKTSKDNMLKESHPIEGKLKFKNKSINNTFSLAHNGNIPNINKFKEYYNILDKDLDLEINSDTYIVVKIIEKLSEKYDNMNDILINIINKIHGAYSFVILFNNEIYAMRDVYGIKPLCIGKNKDGGYCISSESIALQNYKLIRDVKAGEIVKIDNKLLFKTIYKRNISKTLFCSFEYIYFMKNDSINNNKKIKHLRYQLGFELGLKEKNIIRSAVVLSIPNTAIESAKGFANAVNLEYNDYITKKTGTIRTFILPTNDERINACNNKFNFSPLLKDLNVYIIDDSIVRGNTLKSIVKQLKDIGVRQIHLRITAPPVISECYLGIDIPTKSELIAHNKTIENIKNEFGANSLKYIDIKNMKKIFDENICTSCFDNKYNKKLIDW